MLTKLALHLLSAVTKQRMHNNQGSCSRGGGVLLHCLYTYVKEEVLEMESGVLDHFKFEMTAPRVICFLRRFCFVVERTSEELDRMMFFSLAYTRAQEDSANPLPVNEDAQNILDELHELQDNLQSEGIQK